VKAPSYKGLAPASEKATRAARGASKKTRTKPELILRRALWSRGHRYRLQHDLPGKPDLVFKGKRLAIFCDGDFWHGKDWPARRAKLERGHNAAYWIAKIEANRERDRRVRQTLEKQGWRVLRFWESEIRGELEAVVARIESALAVA